MANIHILNETTIKIEAGIEDALTMISEARSNVEHYAHDIITIYEKMPVFQYTYFCFYAFDSAALFEKMLQIDPKQYLSFSMDAPEAFFYTLYGGMAALHEEAQQYVTADTKN